MNNIYFKILSDHLTRCRGESSEAFERHWCNQFERFPYMEMGKCLYPVKGTNTIWSDTCKWKWNPLHFYFL